ncbi:MAG TPA: ABC transporter permease [Geminicoccaceae bacterium]|nr:ABC transporter permease [Geminicoccus sp.]HMU48349.1 ABC transporter permease [Geminicoccaceae bacterium]
MTGDANRLRLLVLQNAPLLLFVLLIATFAILSERFLTPTNFLNILAQAAHIAIIAIGMTFVLLVAGIDLSVGANMYASCIVVALYMKGMHPVFGFTVAGLLGLLFGAFNALMIVKLRVPAFIATLSTLFIGRAVALYLSGVKMIGFGREILLLGRSSFLGVPAAIWIFLAVFLIAWIVLRQTTFGRQIYAVGADPEAAKKAGIDVGKILFAVYCICGLLAGIGGMVSATQVAAASSTFGFQKEFPVIAAAVLGGTSLFGGRGGVIGTVFGAVLIQTVENGLVMTNADPYVYPLIISAIIFIAVLVDSIRTGMLERLERRKIRVEPV